MRDAGIGRLLVASLHQAIADQLPDRLEFYENWLRPEGLWHGTIGPAPLAAVLSFLRQEGAAYHAVVQRAGDYAAEWSPATRWRAPRALLRCLPRRCRSRLALRAARRLIRQCHPASRAAIKVRRDAATLTIQGSIFCSVRDHSAVPLCGFYAAALGHLLRAYGVEGAGVAGVCRAMGDPACVISIGTTPEASSVPGPAAAGAGEAAG